MTEKRAGDTSLGLEVSKGFVAKLIQAVLGFAGTILFARILGPTDFGGYYLLLSLVGLAERPASGVSGATRKRFAESGSPRREIVGFQTVFNGLFVAVVAVGAGVLHEQLAAYTGLDDAAILFVLLFASLITFSTYQSFLTSIGRVGTQTWIDTIRSVLTTGLQLLFVLAGLAATGMVFGLAGATLLSVPVTFWYVRTLPSWPSRETVASIWSFAKYNIPGKVVGKAYDRFDILLLGLLASPAVAGEYEVAYKLTVPAMLIAGISSSGLMARVSDLRSRGEPIADDVVNTLAFSSSLAIPIFFGSVAIPAAIVVTAYGPEYRDAAWLLVGLALYRVVQTQSSVLSGLLEGLDRPDVTMRVSAFALGVNVALGVGLFYAIGPVGVVVATVVAEFVRYASFYRVLGKAISARLLPRALSKQVVAGTVMFGLVEIASTVVAVRAWHDLVLLVLLGATVYFLLLTVLSHHFRVTVRGILGQIAATYR